MVNMNLSKYHSVEYIYQVHKHDYLLLKCHEPEKYNTKYKLANKSQIQIHLPL